VKPNPVTRSAPSSSLCFWAAGFRERHLGFGVEGLGCTEWGSDRHWSKKMAPTDPCSILPPTLQFFTNHTRSPQRPRRHPDTWFLDHGSVFGYLLPRSHCVGREAAGARSLPVQLLEKRPPVEQRPPEPASRFRVSRSGCREISSGCRKSGRTLPELQGPEDYRGWGAPAEGAALLHEPPGSSRVSDFVAKTLHLAFRES